MKAILFINMLNEVCSHLTKCLSVVVIQTVNYSITTGYMLSLQKVDNMYLLTEWEGRNWKIFGSRSGRTDRAQRGPYVLTESQIFSRPARPYSVNKHFII